MDAAYYVEEEIVSYHGVVNNLSVVERVEYEITDAFENVAKSGEIVYNTENGAWIIENFGLVIGWNNVNFRIYRTDGTMVEETHSYLNYVYENMEKTEVGLADTDEDGINDYFESVYGTDMNSADSDGDGLNDFEEMLSGTDPAVQDAAEDVDEDGLTALEELKYGTSPLYSDSDLDGIDDKTEVTVSGTDPVKEDTDGDGLTDGEELKLGTNPLVGDSDGNGIQDSEEKIEQEVSLELEDKGVVSEVAVSLACSGDIEHQVFVKNIMEEDELSANVVGLVGVPVEINSMTPFDEAEITFRYDRTQLGEAKEENLCIMWYDEENMTYVLMEDCVIDTQNQTVSVTTTHFSTYLLIDKEIWLDAWRSEIDYDEMTSEDIKSTYDIYVCLDYSMSPEEFALGKEFVQKIIDQMVEGDRISLGIAFINNRYTYYELESKSSATVTLENLEKAILGEYYEEPSGNHRSDLNFMVYALSEINKRDSTNEKMGIIVNSGKNEPIFYMHTDEDVKRFLQKMNYPVYSVSVTYDEDEEFVDILEEYGGKGFIATTSDRLINDYHLGCDTLDMLDTDGDGLADTYEINGVRIQNGTVVYTDPYSVDSDGDGITDFAELGGEPQKVLMCIDRYEFETTINFQLSDATDTYSSGKKIDVNYMIVEDFDYLPYNKSTYEKIFINNTLKIDSNGENIYGLYNIYNSNPNEMTLGEKVGLLTRATIQCNIANRWALDYASMFLRRYISNKSERYIYDCSAILGSNLKALDVFAVDVWNLMKASEGFLEQNQCLIIAQTPENENNGVSFDWKDPDSFLAIKDANTRVVAEVSFDGEKYFMKLKYYIFDYYDWEESQTTRLGLVADNELYKLCRAGGARFYENWGVVETEISWEATDSSRNLAIERCQLGLMLGLY